MFHYVGLPGKNDDAVGLQTSFTSRYRVFSGKVRTASASHPNLRTYRKPDPFLKDIFVYAEMHFGLCSPQHR